MSTRSLLHWAALIAGAELAARGYLLDRPAWFHGGAGLLFAVCALGAWRLRERRGAAQGLAAFALVPALLSALTWAAAGGEAEAANPRLEFWAAHPTDRTLLSEGVEAASAVRRIELFGHAIDLDARGYRAIATSRRSGPSGTPYRVVAVGGSSTFGATRTPAERPWPEILEEAIQRDLTCAVPVEVVGAGVLGRGLPYAADTFETAILPLAPQLILLEPSPREIELLAADLPELRFDAPAPTPRRASRPLRRLEEAWRARAAGAAFQTARERVPQEFGTRQTKLASTYRHLLVEARRHGIDVVLASLDLAVTPDSSDAEIRRLEALDPRTRSALLGLDVHRRLVAQMAATYRATFVDLPHDAETPEDALFLDLHLRTERGRVRLAERLLTALGPKLAQVPPRCVPRARPPGA